MVEKRAKRCLSVWSYFADVMLTYERYQALRAIYIRVPGEPGNEAIYSRSRRAWERGYAGLTSAAYSWHGQSNRNRTFTLRFKVTGYSLGRVPRSKRDNSQCSLAPDYGYKRWSTDREAPRAYTQPKEIGYLVGTVCCGRSNFVNF